MTVDGAAEMRRKGAVQMHYTPEPTVAPQGRSGASDSWADPRPWLSRFNGDRSSVDLSTYNPGLWVYAPRTSEMYDYEQACGISGTEDAKT